MRRQHNFWLDDGIPEQRYLQRMTEGLKKKRRFSPTLRDGLRLMISLRDGSLDVLQELFPGIYEMLRIDILETVLSSLLAENERLRAENERLRAGQHERDYVERGESDALNVVQDTETSDDIAANLLSSLGGFWS